MAEAVSATDEGDYVYNQVADTFTLVGLGTDGTPVITAP